LREGSGRESVKRAGLPTYTSVVEEMHREAVKLLELHGKIPKVIERP
jgi:hypothetical protein